MTDEQLKVWAVEQAIKHHGGTGVLFEVILAEAEKLIVYVKAERK